MFLSFVFHSSSLCHQNRRCAPGARVDCIPNPIDVDDVPPDASNSPTIERSGPYVGTMTTQITNHRPRRFLGVTMAITLTISLALNVLPSVFHGATRAADSDEIETALVSLDVLDPSEELIDRLSLLLDTDDLEPTDESTLQERIRVRLRLWSDVAPEWREVDRSLMNRVRTCRDASATDGCGEQLRLELRLRHAERVMERIEQRLLDAEALPTDDRDARIAALEMIMERVRTRLTQMAQLSDEELGPLSEERTLMLRIRERIQNRLDTTSTTIPSTSNPSQPPGSNNDNDQDQEPKGNTQ